MILDRYLLRQFSPLFFVAVSMFSFLLLLIDLFTNIIRYLNNEVPITTMLRISLLFIPKSFSYAMPISLLFAGAYTLGDLYAKNELTMVFSSGIPFRRFCLSFILLGLTASVFSFFLDDIVVIPTLKNKNELSRRALNQQVTVSNYDIVIKTRNGRLVYSVDFFDNERQVLNGVSIVEMDENGEFISQIRAHSAAWNGNYWEFRNAVIYRYEDGMLRIFPLLSNTSYNEHPDVFRRSALNIEELTLREAALMIDDMRSLGLPFYQAQTNYYRRYSFASTSLIVMLFSISMGTRFRKNILLMSLFTSLASAVVYYVTEMLSMTMAGLNYIPPAVGAWFPVFLFLAVGLFLLRSVKT
jgi:lipopolysaccharide export system permease protein